MTAQGNPAAGNQVEHIVWPDDDDSNSGSAPFSASRLDGIEMRAHSSTTSEALSQASSGTGLSWPRQHSPTNTQGSLPNLDSEAPDEVPLRYTDSVAGSDVESVNEGEAEVAWGRLSVAEQGDVVTMMLKTAEDGTLPSCLREFWSKGTKPHIKGSCRPCHYIHTNAGCKNGSSCRYCHVPHTKDGSTRPSRSQRMQCKRFVAALSDLRLNEGEGSKDMLKQVASRSPYLQALLTGQGMDMIVAGGSPSGQRKSGNRKGGTSGKLSAASTSISGGERRPDGKIIVSL